MAGRKKQKRVNPPQLTLTPDEVEALVARVRTDSSLSLLALSKEFGFSNNGALRRELRRRLGMDRYEREVSQPLKHHRLLRRIAAKKQAQQP